MSDILSALNELHVSNMCILHMHLLHMYMWPVYILGGLSMKSILFFMGMKGEYNNWHETETSANIWRYLLQRTKLTEAIRKQIGVIFRDIKFPCVYILFTIDKYYHVFLKCANKDIIIIKGGWVGIFSILH